ncbi:MAG: alpha/beta hydrolase [Rhodospirillales bacterium]|nr:alpha/beta hydrolase [Rhodospirillales bacterium]
MKTRKYVAWDDVRIDLIVEGEGPPLVMLPSSARDSEDFDQVAALLAAAGFRVLRPQPRGMCGSTGPLEGLTLHDYASDVARVIRSEGNAPAIVFGHAFGQWVGRMLAADHAKLVRGVVLAAAAAKKIDPVLREELNRCRDLSLPDSVRLGALRRAFFAPGHDPTVWLRNWHPLASRAQQAASAATPQHAWWSAGTAPILDLQAGSDPWRPRETVDDIREELGADRVTVVVIPDASHALLPEQPEAVVRAVVDWARGLQGTSGGRGG